MKQGFDRDRGRVCVCVRERESGCNWGTIEVDREIEWEETINSSTITLSDSVHFLVLAM